MIKAVIFDCFGVLTTDTWKAFLEGLPTSVNIGRLRELNRQLDAALLSHDDFLQQVFEVSGGKPVEVETLLNNEIVKNEELLRYIRMLRQRGLKIGLLSNISTNWIRDTFLTKQEQALFDEIVLSFEVRMTKPQVEIFELVCERLGMQPSEAIMVDDVVGNCDAARSIGMKSVLYNDFQSVKNTIESLLIS